MGTKMEWVNIKAIPYNKPPKNIWEARNQESLTLPRSNTILLVICKRPKTTAERTHAIIKIANEVFSRCKIHKGPLRIVSSIIGVNVIAVKLEEKSGEGSSLPYKPVNFLK